LKAVCIGGGPAGLYFAIALKRLSPDHQVSVIERNRPYDTFGWGVVFSDQTMESLERVDPQSAAQILDNFAHWDDIDVHYRGEVITSGGHGFAGIGRKRLLNILQDRCKELGVALEFEKEVTELAPYRDADLIVASDGVNSRVRGMFADTFKQHITMRPNKFIWLGTHKAFQAFMFAFEETPQGLIWAHAYRFDKDTSTFIVECTEETWRALGFDRASTDDTIAICERIFARYLDGHKLLSNARHMRGSEWLNFPHLTCERWFNDNVVLIGDAAHTAHFSVGSGTKLALDDAIALARYAHERGVSAETLTAFQDERQLDVIKLQNAARNSTEWFEHLPRYTRFAPMQFAYSLLTRSQRVSHENLRLRDSTWLESLESWLAQHSGSSENRAIPPMFTPFKLREMVLSNRVVVSPMSMYSAVDGMPADFHLVHYGARAQGGASLVITEMTDVSPQGRITPGCAGIYTDEQTQAWKRIVDFVHRETPAKICLQLGHAGPKGSVRVPWEGDDAPLENGNWELLAPSAIAWTPGNQTPRAMDRADMDRVIAEYAAATTRAEMAGFDMIELHMAHGYLLSAFLTPLTNERTDEYGGSVENRLRFPLEVFAAVRAAWPKEKPISVRISASDWAGEEGNSEDDIVAMARAFHAAGADIIDVSAGQTTPDAKPVYGRMFQTPFSDLIRNEADVPTMAVGNIYEIDHVNSIIAAGRADLCCLARPHLTDPYWTLRAAAQQGYDSIEWPKPYAQGGEQLKRNLRRAG
jgi:anthraniloyl-CoA monooxygenase